MLKKLTKNQIADQWELISHAIENNLEPIVLIKGEQIKQNMLIDLLQVFALLDETAKIPLRGYVVTIISKDYLGETKSLIVLKAVAVEEISGDAWTKALVDIVQFARKTGCHRVMGLTENDHVAAFARQLGADAKFRFLTLEG